MSGGDVRDRLVTAAAKKARGTKGRRYYGRRVRNSGAPPVKHKRKRFLELLEDRCEKHHAFKAGCNCVRTEETRP